MGSLAILRRGDALAPGSGPHLCSVAGRVLGGYQDTWAEGQPERDPALVPPSGRYQPIRGFGKVWREQLGGLEVGVGWAAAEESGATGLVQPFALGLLLQGEKGVVYALYSRGTWEII